MLIDIDDSLITGGHLFRVAEQVGEAINHVQTDGGDVLLEVTPREHGTPTQVGVRVVYHGDEHREAIVRFDPDAVPRTGGGMRLVIPSYIGPIERTAVGTAWHDADGDLERRLDVHGGACKALCPDAPDCPCLRS